MVIFFFNLNHSRGEETALALQLSLVHYLLKNTSTEFKEERKFSTPSDLHKIIYMDFQPTLLLRIIQDLCFLIDSPRQLVLESVSF